MLLSVVAGVDAGCGSWCIARCGSWCGGWCGSWLGPSDSSDLSDLSDLSEKVPSPPIRYPPPPISVDFPDIVGVHATSAL